VRRLTVAAFMTSLIVIAAAKLHSAGSRKPWITEQRFTHRCKPQFRAKFSQTSIFELNLTVVVGSMGKA
jgi:hypothetical protein